MYVAVKGGEAAIDAAHEALAKRRRGNIQIAELSVAQIREQLALAVDRVMMEGSLYDPARRTRDQTGARRSDRGNLSPAGLPHHSSRLAASEPVDTAAMRVERRISAALKDLPGGQVLGATFDYTHRLLDFFLLDEFAAPEATEERAAANVDHEAIPRVVDLLGAEALIERMDASAKALPCDITRSPTAYPASRDVRLQALSRADEGFPLAMGYSTQRGYGNNHPFAAEIRQRFVCVEIVPPELGFPIA